MDQILFIRETIVKFCKKYQALILTVTKFICALFIFNYINEIGYVDEELIKYTKPPLEIPLILSLCILFTVFQLPVGYMLIIAFVALQLSAFLEVAVIVTIFLLIIMFFYIRLAPEQCILILITMAGFYFKAPYMVPIIAGLYMGLASIVPISIGIFLWQSFIPLVQVLLTRFETAGSDFMSYPETFSDLYAAIMNHFKVSNEWVFWAFIFTMVVVLVYVITKLSTDYAKEIAIALGAVLNILSFIMIVIITGLDMNVFFMFISTVLSVIVVYAIRFFDCMLDYSRAESVQFEDDDNYYYVKVIPKINLTKKKRVVKRIRPENDD